MDYLETKSTIEDGSWYNAKEELITHSTRLIKHD